MDSVVDVKISADPIECCQFRVPEKPFQANDISNFKLPNLEEASQEATEEYCDLYTDISPCR